MCDSKSTKFTSSLVNAFSSEALIRLGLKKRAILICDKLWILPIVTSENEFSHVCNCAQVHIHIISSSKRKKAFSQTVMQVVATQSAEAATQTLARMQKAATTP
jgi:hypothetical protein